MAIALLAFAGILIGGAISLRGQKAPMWLVVLVGLCGALATAAGLLRL